MAPKLINNSKNKKTKQKNLNFQEINKKLKEYKKFIEKNFDMLVKTLHMRQEQYIIIKKKEKRYLWNCIKR